MQFGKRLIYKYVEALESIKAWVLIFLGPKRIGIIKQGVGFEDNMGLGVTGNGEDSSYTVFIVTGRCRFPIVYLHFEFKTHIVTCLDIHQLYV